jgi:aldose 1-epimerase
VGVEAVEHSLESATGLSVVLSTRGARIVSVRVPAPRGETVEVTDPTGPYAGATVGRYANRIGGARFELDGHEHCLPANDGTASLHGGPEGFDRRVWSAAAEVLPGGGRVVMDTVSPDGDQGFPGTLAVHAAFTLVGDCLRIEYEATTDRPTVMSLTTHMYWNLGGAEGRGRPIDQDLLVAAERYLAIDDEKIPTGAVLDVRGTAFDFRHRRTIEHDYDHCYVLDGHDPAAVLCDPR